MTVIDSALVVLWAQRADKVMISLQLQDVSEEKINVDETGFSFRGTSGGKEYATKLELNSKIIPEESKQRKGGREYYFELKKRDQGPWWPRLLKDTQKYRNIKVDFNRWKDEDESDDEAPGNKYDDQSLEDMMQQMGTGAGSFDPGEEEYEDSDEEDLPALEGEATK